MKAYITALALCSLSSCVVATNFLSVRCGDDIIDTGEACDDGNTTNGDGCDENCTISDCGNGILAGLEECDDGNTLGGDGCEDDCTLPACGDGVRSADEECDDGNLLNGDTCEADCTLPFCGNSIVDAGENCDDGNTVSSDGCQSNCRLPGCGDGFVESPETCDDGNDVNGDGCDRNCTPTGCGNSIATLGEVCFAPQAGLIPAGDSPEEMASADFDNDGDIDIALVSSAANQLRVFLNVGDGSFANPIVLGFPSVPFVGSANPRSITVGDFDQNGFFDIVVATERNAADGFRPRNIYLFSNTASPQNPTVTFSAPREFFVGDFPVAVRTADVNADGLLDIVVITDDNVIGSERLCILFNQGGNNFQERTQGTFQQPVRFALGNEPSALLSTDLSGDGVTDFLVSNRDSNNMRFFAGVGDFEGSLGGPSDTGLLANPSDLALLNIDNNSLLDVAAVHAGVNTLRLLLNTSTGNVGQFAVLADLAMPNGVATLGAVTTGDIDLNGEPDVLVAGQTTNNVALFFQDGQSFVAGSSLITTGNEPVSLQVTDFNGDGTPDLAVLSRQSDGLQIFFSQP